MWPTHAKSHDKSIQTSDDSGWSTGKGKCLQAQVEKRKRSRAPSGTEIAGDSAK